jgi:hypothetical protein
MVPFYDSWAGCEEELAALLTTARRSWRRCSRPQGVGPPPPRRTLLVPRAGGASRHHGAGAGA